MRSLHSLARNPGLAVCLFMALIHPDTGLSGSDLAADMTLRHGPFDATSPDALEPAHAALLRFARESGGIARLSAVAQRFAGLSAFEEASLVDLFRDPSERGLRLPGRATGCGPNENCIADEPPALLLSKIRVDGRDVPVLVGGEAEVTSRLIPRSEGLPGTAWRIAEPMSRIAWVAVWNADDGGRRSFMATLPGPADANDRREALEKIAANLNSR